MADISQERGAATAGPGQGAVRTAEPAQAGPIWLRLALAFLAVALAAVALLAGLTAALAATDVSHLASQQRKELATALAVAAGSAWDRTGSWAGADLTPVLDLAADRRERPDTRSGGPVRGVHARLRRKHEQGAVQRCDRGPRTAGRADGGQLLRLGPRF